MTASHSHFDPSGSPSLKPRTRRILSVLLMLHLVAIVSAPWAMSPSSELSQSVFRFFQPWLDAAYLNHGYHFFAPEPGPCHSIRYELQFADGTRAEGVFPDPQAHSPRLLYHRHFMLTETAGRLAVDESSEASLRQLSQSFATHLLAETGAARVQLVLRRRYIPTPEQVATGLPLTAPELLAERPLGTFELSGSQRTAVPSPVRLAERDDYVAQSLRD